MNTDERKKQILNLLVSADEPISAKDLAARFNVSRQVIVQDMAVIRASHPDIISTNRGYVKNRQESSACMRELKLKHKPEQAAEELNIIVDLGGHVKNISVSHKIYGRISAELDISSRQDALEFTKALDGAASTVLSTVTGGYHYHLIEASSEKRLDMIEAALDKAGFLAPLTPWEKENGILL